MSFFLYNINKCFFIFLINCEIVNLSDHVYTYMYCSIFEKEEIWYIRRIPKVNEEIVDIARYARSRNWMYTEFFKYQREPRSQKQVVEPLTKSDHISHLLLTVKTFLASMCNVLCKAISNSNAVRKRDHFLDKKVDHIPAVYLNINRLLIIYLVRKESEICALYRRNSVITE